MPTTAWSNPSSNTLTTVTETHKISTKRRSWSARQPARRVTPNPSRVTWLWLLMSFLRAHRFVFNRTRKYKVLHSTTWYWVSVVSYACVVWVCKESKKSERELTASVLKKRSPNTQEIKRILFNWIEGKKFFFFFWFYFCLEKFNFFVSNFYVMYICQYSYIAIYICTAACMRLRLSVQLRHSHAMPKCRHSWPFILVHVQTQSSNGLHTVKPQKKKLL